LLTSFLGLSFLGLYILGLYILWGRRRKRKGTPVKPRLDVVLLVLDTQRADRLSSYGYAAPTSPNLDAFAADATLFRHAITPAQWTVPTHASLFTGLYPSVHGTRQSYSILPKELPTLAERLTAGGYFTAAYCNNPLVGVVDNGLRRGFTSFLNYAGLFTAQPNQAGQRRTLFGAYRNWFKRNVSTWVHKLQDSFARSDAMLEFAITAPFFQMVWQTALSFKGNTVKSLNDAARLLVERKGLKADQPIFTFINLMGTHMPFHPQRKYIEQFAPDYFADRAAQRYLQRFNSDVLGWLTPAGAKMAEQHRAIISGMYDAEIATQDEQIGLFLDKLRKAGRLDQTYFVVVADHGEHLGEKHFIGHNVTLYNELTHVPLIVRDPRGNLATGAQPDHLVSTRRVFHSILDAAELAEDHEEIYALAHSPVNDPDQGIVFAEAVTPQNVLNIITKHTPDLVRPYRCDEPRRAVWQDRHKLILTGKEMKELYDFIADPQELHNLAEANPALVKAQTERILAFERQNAAAALTAGHMAETDDANLRSRLRALGYME
jgi:arylsulfatase A-like enzyme